MHVKNTIRFMILPSYLVRLFNTGRVYAVAMFWSHLLLARGLKQHNCYGCSQIQAARPMHRDGDAIVRVGRE
jgi:hypothetical protein